MPQTPPNPSIPFLPSLPALQQGLGRVRMLRVLQPIPDLISSPAGEFWVCSCQGGKWGPKCAAPALDTPGGTGAAQGGL